MEACLTSLHQLPIWFILLSDQGKSSLFSTASIIPFPFLSFCLVVPLSQHSVCLPSSWMLFSLLPAHEPCCLKLFQLSVFVAHVLLFSKIHNFTSFSPGGGLRQTSEGLACLQMMFPPHAESPAWVFPYGGLKGVKSRKEPEERCGLWTFAWFVVLHSEPCKSPLPKVLQCHGGESQRRTGAWTDCWRASSPTPGSRQYQLQI